MKSKALRAVGLSFLITGIAILCLTGFLMIKLDQDEKHADEASKRAMSIIRLAAEQAKQTPVDDGESVLFAADGTIDDVERMTEEAMQETTVSSVSRDGTNHAVNNLNAQERQEDQEEERREEKLMIDGTGYLGYLSFPGFDRELPVIADWDFEMLKEAPMCYEGSLEENNLVIAGHAYKAHFGFFENEKAGNTVVFHDLYGNRINYTIVEKEVMQPTEIEKMITGDWDLTLFTCTYNGQARLALRCVRSE